MSLCGNCSPVVCLWGCRGTLCKCGCSGDCDACIVVCVACVCVLQECEGASVTAMLVWGPGQV